MAKYLVIGGVAAGAAFAAKMRRLDEDAEITVFERGPYVSYANCGLPYYIGGVIEEEAELILHTPATLKARFNITVLVNTEVLAIDRKQKAITAKDLPSGALSVYPYDKLLLAPGARALRPKIAGVGLPGVFTLKDMADTAALKDFITKQNPMRAAVIGGGFIGLEAAENFCALGLETTVVEATGQIMPNFDHEMAALLQNHLRQKKVDLRLNTVLSAIEEKDGKLSVCLSGEKGGELPVDLVLLAIGARPETALAEAAGLALGVTGGIKTNEYMQTSDEDIYAAGDAAESTHSVTGRPVIVALAGNAGKQARVAAAHIAGARGTFNKATGASVAKIFALTAAAVGANEKQLVEAGLYYAKVYLHPASHAAYYPGGAPLAIKLLFAADGRVLGAQVVGKEGADKRADIFAVAVKAGLSVYDLGEMELSYAPPYSSARDPVNYAGDIAALVLSGALRQAFWQDGQRAGEERFLLDVRTVAEYARGSVPGALNIPLHELRGRLGELPIGKTLYVFCQSGLRSYIACRVLAQKGFDAVNMSGGYISWREIALDRGDI